MDRRLILLLLTAALAVILGFVLLTPEQSLLAVIYGGYWAMLVLTLLFGWFLLKLARESWPGLADWRNKPRWPVALLIGFGLLLLAHYTHRFQILIRHVMLL